MECIHGMNEEVVVVGECVYFMVLHFDLVSHHFNDLPVLTFHIFNLILKLLELDVME